MPNQILKISEFANKLRRYEQCQRAVTELMNPDTDFHNVDREACTMLLGLLTELIDQVICQMEEAAESQH